MFNRTIQAQSQLLDMYYSMVREVNQSITESLQNAEKLQRSQIDLAVEALERNGRLADRLWNQKNLSGLLVAQTQLSADQVSEGMDLWRNYVRALQDSQLATLSSTRARVEEATEEVAKAAEEAARKAQTITKGTDITRPAGKETRSGAKAPVWSGIERRKAANTEYSGIERRKAA
jgi:hypothetical protein